MQSAYASSAFLAVLNETMGIFPEKSKSEHATKKSAVAPKNVKRNKVTPSSRPSIHSNGRTDSGKTTSRAKAPLVVDDLLDEDAEGLTQDWEIDLWSKADLNWSNEAAELKAIVCKFKTSCHKATSKEREIFSEEYIFGFFKTLRLVDKKISRIDVGVKKLKNLKELSLTGNLIESFEPSNLPQDIQILHLNANRLAVCPNISKLASLIHFGASHNLIKSVDGFVAPSCLVSLDLSGNELCDLNGTVQRLECIPNLQILALLRNPLFLIEGYRKTVVSKMMRLIVLDDVNVSISERSVNEAAASVICPVTNSDVTLMIKLDEMTGLKQPDIEEPADSRPLDEVVYHIEAIFNEYSGVQFECANSIQWTQDLIEVATVNCVSLPITKKTRDAFNGSISLKLHEKRFAFTPIVNDILLSSMSIGGVDPGTRPGSSASKAGMRPISGSKKEAPRPISPKKDTKKPADKGKKGPPGKGKKDDDVQYEKKLVSQREVGFAKIHLEPFLDGKKVINGDYHFERELEGSTVPLLVCTVRTTFKLHPTLEDRAISRSHQKYD
ncbi:hypothetical protein BDR26DRAFT_919422 [Obelidium mucronatum]|nr:hypothetical protein BDR26DRAFT_919422 [Obelidium mucronatum]